MLFDLEQEGGVWFDFQESEVDLEGKITFLPVKSGAGRVCVRQADAEFFEKLYKNTRKKVVDIRPNSANRNALERIENLEVITGKEKEEREALIDHWIVDWENLRDAKKLPIPCTKENKMKLMKLGVFRRFIDECHRKIASTGGLVKEEAENL